MRESKIQRDILLELGKRPDCMVQRINSGLLADPHSAMRRIRTAPPGIPDVMVLIPGGRVVWLETKARRGKTEASQKKWAKAAAQRGHQVHYVRTVEQAVAAVDEAIELYAGECRICDGSGYLTDLGCAVCVSGGEGTCPGCHGDGKWRH